MATLRDMGLGVSTDDGRANALHDQDLANGMGSLRRGWETGRIGNEMNPMHTQALEAEIAGDMPRANALRSQIGALQQRQQMFAPQVGRLEDIHGVGDAASYAAGQVGQGAASMVDPMAVSAGLGVAGRVLPGMYGKVAQGAALGIPYLMSKNQLQGEFIGDAERDPELMARTSKQGLRDMAGNYGALAAIPDSALPGMVGRQVSGLSRAGSTVARKAAMGPGIKTLGGMAMEGGTEALQGQMSHEAQGMLNPNRDTSGDAMDDWNNFAGGALGSGPFAAGGAYAEAGHNRIGAGVDGVKGAVGSVVDIMNESPTIQKGISKAKDMAAGARGSVMDILANEDGDVTVGGVVGKAKDAVQKYKQSAEDMHTLLNDAPPAGLDPTKTEAWFTQYDAKRESTVDSMLSRMGDDPVAQQHVEAINAAPDIVGKAAARDQAASYLIGLHDETDVKTNLSGWGTVASAVGQGVGSTAVKFGKGIFGLAKDVVKGAKDGASKKNFQTDESGQKSGNADDPYLQWQERTGFPNAKGGSATAEAAVGSLDEDASYRRAVLFGNKLSQAANASGHADVAPALRDMGYQIAGWSSLDKAAKSKDAPAMQLAISEIGNNLRVIFGHKAAAVIGEMERLSPEEGELFQALKEELVSSGTPEGRALREQLRSTAADKLMMLLPKAHHDEFAQTESGKFQLLNQFEKLAGGGFPREIRDAIEKEYGRSRLNHMLGIVNGLSIDSSKQGEAVMTEGVDDFEQAQAQKKLDKGSSHIYAFGGNLTLRTKEDGDPFGKTKKLSKGEAAAAELQGDDSVRRPQLYKTDDMWDQPGQSGENKLAARIKEVEDTVGFKRSTVLKADGTRDEAFDESDGWGVESVPAWDVMDGKSPTEKLALYRDYLRMDAQTRDPKQAGGKLKAAKNATEMKMLVGQLANRDAMEAKAPNSWTAGEFSAWKDQLAAAITAGYKGSQDPGGEARTDGQDVKFGSGLVQLNDFLQEQALKKAQAYFSERHIVRAYSMTDNDEQKMGVDLALKLQQAGKKRADKVRLDAYAAGDDQEAADKVVADANILYFPKDGKDIPIVGSDLVKWAKTVQDKRGQSQSESDQSHNPAKTNARYFQELMDGINAYATEHADGLPYKFNPGGEKESFNDGVPPSLMLANAPYHEAVKETGFRLTNKSKLGLEAQEGNPEKQATQSEGNQAAVSADQAKQDDFFTPEDREERTLAESPWTADKRRSGKDDTSTAAHATDEGGELVTRGPNNKDINNPSARGTSTSIRADVSGKIAHEPKTDDPNATEIDFSKGQDPKAEADEMTAQKYFTEHTTAKYAAPVNALHGMSSAKHVADGVMKTMFDDPRAGDREAVTLLRTALKPGAYKDAKGKTYEAYRVAPLIRLVSTDREKLAGDTFRPLTHQQYFENAGATPELVNIIRRGAAQVLQRDSNMSDAHKLKLARQLLGVAGTTQGNFVARLQALINSEGGVVTADELRVNWGDPSTLPTTPVMKAQPHVAAPKTMKEKAAAKADTSWELTDAELASLEVAPKVAPVHTESNEAPRRARNAVDTIRAAKALSPNDQLLAASKARLAAAKKAGGTGSPVGKPGGAPAGVKRNNQADGQWMYHGTRAKDEMLVQPDGSLLLKPSKNYGGKTNGVSFTHDLNSATDYATRVKGGGPDGFRFTGAKVLKINRAALANIEEETFGEWADYTGKDVVIPKGMYSIEPVARTRALLSDSYLMDSGDFSFRDYLKENYSSMERENLYQDDGLMSMTKEEFLDQIVDPESESSAEDVAEANAILRDEFGRKNNAQVPDGEHNLASAGEMAAAQTWLNKVAPGTILKFVKESGWSGEFIEAQNLINVSTTAAAGIMGTTYHEGLHKFFAQFVRSNPKLRKMFEGFANDPRILARLNELLKDYPAAQAQLVDGEERLAYAFQFWKAGLLKVDNENRSFMQQVGALFRRVLGMVRDSEHALAIFQAFDSGQLAEPSVAAKVIAAQLGKGAMALRARRGLDGMMQGLAAATLPAEVILGQNQHSETARKLSKILFTNPGDEKSGGGQVGYLNAKRSESKRWMNQANALFETMDKGDVDAVQKYMQAQTDPADIKLSVHRDAVVALRKTLDEFHTYMKDAGLKIGKIDKYYPTVWSVDALHKNKAAFIKMLVSKYAQQMNPDGGNAQKAAERIWAALIERNGVDAKALTASRDAAVDPNAPKAALREDGVLSPFFAGQEQQTLWWLDGADKEAYQTKNMTHTLSQYFHQGVRAAEYHSRFGENGIKLEIALKKIRTELTAASNKMLADGEIKNDADRVKWLARQTRDITMSVGAIEGTLGKDISPNMRKFNSYMIAYQNIRLLPYMIFSSFVDPLAQVARGAPVGAALEIFTYGMREVFRAWADLFRDMPKERQKDEWAKIAEHIGAVEVAMFNHHVAEEYSSVYMSPLARKVNETLFKLNGMEAWDRANRTMATKWAVRFIEQHKGLPDKQHSQRWLTELGLAPASIPVNADGQLITSAEELSVVKGITLADAKQQIAPIHAALNRWVEGAVISPNAAQRPGWSSDPNYAAMFHLKQFSYSFQQTIMKRALNEMDHGNLKPISALAGFVPTMLAADLIKGLIQGAGELPPYMSGMDAGERIMHAIKRSGLGGTNDIAVNALEDWSSLGGPALEQAVDALRDDIGRTSVKALPLHAMGEYLFSGGKQAVGGPI